MDLETIPLMRNASVLDGSAVVINDMLTDFREKNFIAQDVPYNPVTDLNARNRPDPASFGQRELLSRSILKCTVEKVILYGNKIPQEVYHELLGSLFPFAALNRGLVSLIQVVGVTDYLLIRHKIIHRYSNTYRSKLRPALLFILDGKDNISFSVG